MHRLNASGLTVRPLLASDRDAALDLLQNGLREVPIYRWLLGDGASDGAFRWYGEILFVEYLSGLQGVFNETDLIALIAVARDASEPGRADDDLKARTRHYIQTINGFAQRFAELKTKTSEAAVPGGDLRVIFALVHPSYRRNGTLSALVEPIVEEGRRAGLTLTASSSEPELRELYARKWNARVCGEFALTDGPTVWCQRLDL
ncbi:hypothetical protein M0655_20855 [Gordonia amicalis]|uniref:hypothetical protein n=1 Tax=Gordonia TaxID=2053 RepID=UPI00177E1203|nr:MULTISPECIES: hypothetical protein [Gordonia]MCR8900102.1 hypothetical protein [Gordonia sp. GONU]UPW16348.1 hypothetical protein M0655_20855 [Gordonia amicalis]